VPQGDIMRSVKFTAANRTSLQASMMALTLIFSPILMTQTLSTFSVDTAPIYFPGAAFLLAAIITLLALIPFAIGVRANRDSLGSVLSGKVEDTKTASS